MTTPSKQAPKVRHPPAHPVLAEEPNNVKALHRRAVAHEKLGGWAHLNSSLEGRFLY